MDLAQRCVSVSSDQKLQALRPVVEYDTLVCLGVCFVWSDVEVDEKYSTVSMTLV